MECSVEEVEVKLWNCKQMEVDVRWYSDGLDWVQWRCSGMETVLWWIDE